MVRERNADAARNWQQRIGSEIRRVSRAFQESKFDIARLQAVDDFERGRLPLVMPFGVVAHVPGDALAYPLRQKGSGKVSESKSQLGAVTKRKQALPLGVVEAIEQAGALAGILQRLEQGGCKARETGRH